MKYHLYKYIRSMLFLFLLSFPLNLQANNYVNFKVIKLNNNSIEISFPSPMAVGKVIIPDVNKELWGEKRCTFLIISNKTEKKICRVSQTGELTTNFNYHTAKSLILTPIMFNTQRTTKTHKAIRIQGKPLLVKIVEHNLSNFADSLILFHKKNKCFSCHTLYPFATTCRIASDRGISVPISKIKIIGKQLSAMQNQGGDFTFPNGQIYGKITPTLCAGYIFSELTRFQPSLFINLKKIVEITDQLCDKRGNYLSDFAFPPFFIGQTTSDFFASKFLTEYYYLSISFNKQPLDIAQKTLKQIKQKYTILDQLSGTQKLITLFGFPHMCEIPSTEYINAIKSLSPLMVQKGIFNKMEFKTIFQVISEKLYAPPIYKKNNWKNLLADKIWKTLGEIITIKVQDI